MKIVCISKTDINTTQYCNKKYFVFLSEMVQNGVAHGQKRWNAFSSCENLNFPFICKMDWNLTVHYHSK